MENVGQLAFLQLVHRTLRRGRGRGGRKKGPGHKPDAPGCVANCMRVLLVALLVFLAGCADEPAEPADVPETTGTEASAPGNETRAPEPVILDVGLTGIYPFTIAYDPVRIEVESGAEVTIRFTNSDQNPVMSHDWVLEGVDGASTEVIGIGETSEVTFIAPAPGEYAFFCSVGDHRSNGMEGVFVVT